MLATGLTQPESSVGHALADNVSEQTKKNLKDVCQFLIPHWLWWQKKLKWKLVSSYILR